MPAPATARARRVACRAGPETGIFPAGKKQATVPIPSVVIECQSAEVLDDPATLSAIDAAVQGGATAVVLSGERPGRASPTPPPSPPARAAAPAPRPPPA